MSAPTTSTRTCTSRRRPSRRSALGEPVGPVVAAAGFDDQEPDAARLLGAQRAAHAAPAPASTTPTWRSRTTWSSRAPTRASASSTSPNKSNPTQIVNYTGCNVGQGDVIVYGNILVRSWDSPSAATPRARRAPASASAQGFEGIHIFDISNPAEPEFVRALRFADNEDARRPLVGLRLAHRDRRAGPGARRPVHLQRRLERHLHAASTSSGSGSRSDPTDIDVSCIAALDATASRAGQLLPRQQRADERRRHAPRLRDVRGRQRPRDVQVRHGQAAARPDAASPGGVENPTLLWSQQMPGVDDRSLRLVHVRRQAPDLRPRAGRRLGRALPGDEHRRRADAVLHRPGDRRRPRARCCIRARRPPARTARGTTSTSCRPRPATTRRSAATSRASRCSTSSNPAAPKEIAFADPAPLQNAPSRPATGIILGGDWSTYWHNGDIYESDIKRGVISWQLNLAGDATADAGQRAPEAHQHVRAVEPADAGGLLRA